MAINKVVLGDTTLLDLTGDNVTPETLAEGATAHDAAGNVIEGTMPTDNVRYGAQSLTDAQKQQARENISAAAESHSQTASTITAGTFAGQVVANSAGQTPGTKLIRNSKLMAAAEYDAVTDWATVLSEGEIAWRCE